MNGTSQDPSTFRLRCTLYQLRKKGLSGIKHCTQGSLFGVTLLTKRYKSKRCFKPQQSQIPNMENTQNGIKSEIFRRITYSGNKKSAGLQISKAVIHGNEHKKIRVSTQRSIEKGQENLLEGTGKEHLYKRWGKNRKVFGTHRENSSEFRVSCTKSMYKEDQDWRPLSAYTQLMFRRKNRDNPQGSFMKSERQDTIDGWNVQNQEQSDFL